jgi:hypothetical protein
VSRLNSDCTSGAARFSDEENSFRDSASLAEFLDAPRSGMILRSIIFPLSISDNSDKSSKQALFCFLLVSLFPRVPPFAFS